PVLADCATIEIQSRSAGIAEFQRNVCRRWNPRLQSKRNGTFDSHRGEREPVGLRIAGAVGRSFGDPLTQGLDLGRIERRAAKRHAMSLSACAADELIKRA